MAPVNILETISAHHRTDIERDGALISLLTFAQAAAQTGMARSNRHDYAAHGAGCAPPDRVAEQFSNHMIAVLNAIRDIVELLRQAEEQRRRRQAEQEREAEKHRRRQRERAFKQSEEGDWWRVLEVSPDARTDEIRSVYRCKVRQYHPDCVSGLAPEFVELAERRTKALNAAYSQAMRARRCHVA